MKKLLITALLFCCTTALAGPSRPVQSSTFSVQAPCGPAHDPYAQQGQWFLNLESGATNVNAREYHDEDNALSIAGVVQNIQFSDPTNQYSNITGFDILVTVSNTLPSDYLYGSASNSHSEVQTSASVTSGGSTMSDVRITAEFAIPNAGVIPTGTPPYWPDPHSGGLYHIVAANADEHAWYCWAPDQPQPYQPAGAYQVPAWNLTPSTILPGGTATVTMRFQVTGSGIPYYGMDYRHGVLRYSQDTGADVLYNRYPSLKISHWLETIVIDNGVTQATPPPPYWLEDEVEYIHASDASVFYNDRETEQSHKMHYAQMPDPNGWDVRACNYIEDGQQKVLADDFRCTASGPITNITFWGSWFNDEYIIDDPFQGILNIHLSIHDDIPAGEVAQYSMPNLPALKEWDIDPNRLPADWNVVITPETPSPQGWYDPNTGQVEFENHMQYFRYDITIPEEDAFVQVSNTIYWLDVSVQTEFGLWGWKTTTNHWNDDAVFADMPVTDLTQWNELYEPPEFTNSLDLAFLIDGPPEQPPEEEIDWGDAPDSLSAPPGYNTLAVNGGANHTIVPGIFMGTLIDPELDGQPNPTATGDDIDAAGNDEDGVLSPFPPLIPGQPATFTVVVSAPGWLDVWLDVDASGTWTGPDYVFSGPVSTGPNPVLITPPYNSTPGASYMRFRYNTGGPLPPVGNAPDGEVEDYLVNIEEPELDWGDAPDTYKTLSASGGPRHIIATGVQLGATVDAESDGQPTADASGDGADEDGISFAGKLIAGSNAVINVTAGSAGGSLDGWIDYNGNSVFDDPSEHIFGGSSAVLSAGSTNLSFSVPSPLTFGNSYARFRISTAGGLPPDNSGLTAVPDGEVEDYLVDLYQPAPTNLVITNIVVTLSNSLAKIEWAAEPNIAYQTQSTTNLVVSNSWTDVGGLVIQNWQTNSVAPTSQFYRVTAPWTP